MRKGYHMKRQEEALFQDISLIDTAPRAALAPAHQAMGETASGDEKLDERITAPIPAVSSQLDSDKVETNKIEQALQKMNEAARRIAAVEGGRQHKPAIRISRLQPIHNIALEIQRQNSPAPAGMESSPSLPRQEVPRRRLSDPWLWLSDGDNDENESDQWINSTDPLMSRRLPNVAEVARLEEEDVRRAIAEGLMAPPQPANGKSSRRLRLAFLCMAVLAILVLTIDGVLASLVFLHPRHSAPAIQGQPSITLSSPLAAYGEDIRLYVHHFTPYSAIFLTHDVEEPLQISGGKSIIMAGADGSAQTTIPIDSNWNPGFHTITAEDIKTHYAANAMLRIGEGPTRPPHLLLNTTQLDLGSAVQGANTIQPLMLHNSGSGNITWQASSNQSWLQITPSKGIFSDSQTIAVGGQRANLKPGVYTGTITFSSNVGAPANVQVTMSVLSIPANAGAVLSPTPVTLSFTALDGGSDPNTQFAVINNPGSQPLYWSLTNMTQASSGQNTLPGTNDNWLSVDRRSGVIAPGATGMIQVSARTRNLLPGVYTSTLVFKASAGHDAFNSPQNVVVSLSVQPRCGLTLSTGNLSFTAVSGQGNPENQAINVNATTSCPGTVNWRAASSASWLNVTPASGQVSGATGTAIIIGVNTSGLAPHVYNASLTVMTASSTQSIAIQLTVQAPAPPSAPVMSAAPLNISFAATQGQHNLPGQTVTITNSGGSPLTWRSGFTPLVTSWLAVSPTGGTIAPGQTAQATINVDPGNLTPGTYTGQVTLSGTDAKGHAASGSPQTITVNLVVTSPCTLTTPTSATVAFSALQGGSNPTPQTVSTGGIGNCSWPLNWRVHVTSPASWLKLSPATGAFSSAGQAAALTIAPAIAGLSPGIYQTQISIAAADATGAQAAGSPQVISVSLTVQQPCTLIITPGKLAFSLSSGQPSPAQSLALKETGSCAYPVTWTAKSAASWLVVTSNGTDTGNGSTISVSVNGANLSPGTYTGTITISVSGSGGATILSSPSTIPVTLTVAGSGA